MCGYHELQTPCCHEKMGFAPSPSHKCTHFYTNNRYCRTGSLHSWILPSQPLTTNSLCPNCKTAEEHHQALLAAEMRKQEAQREKERKEQEERRKDEEARSSRLWDKEVRRVAEEWKGKGKAVEALRSQLAGARMDNGEGPSSGGKK